MQSVYPIGLQQKSIGLTASISNQQNKYLFNGNELQRGEFSDGSGLELMDFNARMYDPQLGRFMQVDPLSEYMRRWSPFTFSFDDPISFNDPFGMTPSDTIVRPKFSSGESELVPDDPLGHTLALLIVTASATPSVASQIISWLLVIRE